MTFDPTRPPTPFEIDKWPGQYYEQLAYEMAFQFAVMLANMNVFNGVWAVDIAREHILVYMERFAKDHQSQWPLEIRELVEIRLSNQFTPGGV